MRSVNLIEPCNYCGFQVGKIGYNSTLAKPIVAEIDMKIIIFIQQPNVIFFSDVIL